MFKVFFVMVFLLFPSSAFAVNGFCYQNPTASQCGWIISSCLNMTSSSIAFGDGGNLIGHAENPACPSSSYSPIPGLPPSVLIQPFFKSTNQFLSPTDWGVSPVDCIVTPNDSACFTGSSPALDAFLKDLPFYLGCFLAFVSVLGFRFFV